MMTMMMVMVNVDDGDDDGYMLKGDGMWTSTLGPSDGMGYDSYSHL